jgi:hypothetical protein
MEPVKVKSFKMPFATNLFNENQRVWIKWQSGSLSCEVVGRYRGKGRYITAHISFLTKRKEKIYKKLKIDEFEIDKEFAIRHGLYIL